MPWSTLDKLGLGAAWFCGILLCLIAGSIVLYMLVRGLQYLSIGALFEHPVILSTTQSTGTAGGYLDPIEGTLILTLALPILVLPAAESQDKSFDSHGLGFVLAQDKKDAQKWAEALAYYQRFSASRVKP